MTNLKSFIAFCFIFITVSVKGQVQPNITDSRLDFSLPNINGDSIRLSSMKGKVFLLDFWASWCVPCRFSNKELVKLYSKYKDKGFEILGVSLDDNNVTLDDNNLPSGSRRPTRFPLTLPAVA